MEGSLVTPTESWFVLTGGVMLVAYGAVLGGYLSFERALALVLGAGVLVALVVIVYFDAGSELVEATRLEPRK